MFIGQSHIWNELVYIVPRLIEGENVNFLLRGSSGYGKTKLGIMLTNLVDGVNSEYHLPDEAGLVIINPKYRIHLIDEAHNLKSPEMLYPLMDSKKYIFIFMSNEAGVLKEPLVNRCIQFIFQEYTKEEMNQIILHLFRNKGIDLPRDYLNVIAANCNGNPRIATQLVQRLCYIFIQVGFPTIEKLEEIMENILQVKDGLTEIHHRYLEFLRKVGKASLDTISFGTRLDKGTIRAEVEPVLLYKNLIRITPRGRELCL